MFVFATGSVGALFGSWFVREKGEKKRYRTSRTEEILEVFQELVSNDFERVDVFSLNKQIKCPLRWP